jgi:hypothetical protein
MRDGMIAEDRRSASQASNPGREGQVA